jgi:tetratricopeptide (TPR) repeat protein
MRIAGGACALALAAGCVTEETTRSNAFVLAGQEEKNPDGTTTAKSRIRMLEKKVESMPERVDLQMRLARAYHDDKQFEAAIATLTRAIEKEPRNSQIHFLLGEYYVELNRMSEAEASFRSAAESSRKGFTGPSLALGYTLAMQEKYSEAIAEFEKVIAIDSAQPTALYYLACCHDSLGARAKAVEYFTRCADVKSPHQEKAVQELRRLQLLERTGGAAHAGR